MEENMEIRYLAAIIDGDGDIGINKSNERRYRIILEVGNTSELLVHYLQKTYGGNAHGPYKSKHKNRKDRFLWKCSTKEAIKIIKQIEPYLIIKQEQATLALEAWEETFKWDYSRRKREIPKYAIDKREYYYRQMRLLNKMDEKVNNEEDDYDEFKNDSEDVNNEASLYYLAGIIDSKGTIKITRQGRYHQMGLIVSNTSEKLINYLQDNYEGRISGPHKNKIEGNKDIFVWQCNGKDAIKLIKKIKSYLIIKQKQAEVAIEAHKNAFKHSYRGDGANNKVPKSIIDKREHYYQQMKKLNQVGKPDDEEEIEITLKINKNTLKQWLKESDQL